MTIGASEVITIATLLIAFVAWVNKSFSDIDKRFDRQKDDINGLGRRVSLLEGGTCEILTEQINQLRTKLFDLENKL